jgi:hypothetical protein
VGVVDREAERADVRVEGRRTAGEVELLAFHAAFADAGRMYGHDILSPP